MLKSKKNVAYIIAEVGQNHQGKFETAREYIDELARVGVDAVKFQMRDNKTLFSREKLEEPYNSNNAFGKTYGEHRDALELTVEEMSRLREHAADLNLDFMCTPFDEPSLQHLVDMDVDLIKIASFDFGNLPFLEKVIDTGKHFVISAGGSNYGLVDRFVSELIDRDANFSLLHCVSEYPCPIEKVNLGRIEYLKEKFNSVQIGLSDHFSGILTGPLGLLAGAEVFEKHVTFNRSLKGTDHSFSLTIDGMEKFIRDINRTKPLFGTKEPDTIGNEYVFHKLGKSIVAKKEIKSGEIFSTEALTGVITGTGLPVRTSMELLGRVSKRTYQAGEVIDATEIE